MRPEPPQERISQNTRDFRPMTASSLDVTSVVKKDNDMTSTKEERKVLEQVGEEGESYRRHSLSKSHSCSYQGGRKADKTRPQVSQLRHGSAPHQLSATFVRAKVGADERLRGHVSGEPTAKGSEMWSSKSGCSRCSNRDTAFIVQ